MAVHLSPMLAGLETGQAGSNMSAASGSTGSDRSVTAPSFRSRPSSPSRDRDEGGVVPRSLGLVDQGNAQVGVRKCRRRLVRREHVGSARAVAPGLLGLVVEKTSGMSYEDYVEQKIFQPLGMSRSSYCNSAEIVERRAFGYGYRQRELRRTPSNVHTWPFSAGSLCSTAGDMVTWLQALHGGKVLSPKSYAEMTTPSTLNDGTPLRYGMGIGVGHDIRGLKFIGDRLEARFGDEVDVRYVYNVSDVGYDAAGWASLHLWEGHPEHIRALARTTMA